MREHAESKVWERVEMGETLPGTRILNVHLRFAFAGVLAGIAVLCLLMARGTDAVATHALPRENSDVGPRVLAGTEASGDAKSASPRSLAIEEVVRAQMEIGSPDGALASAEAIPSSSERDLALIYVADRLVTAASGPGSEADTAKWSEADQALFLTIIGRINDPMAKVRLLAKAAKAVSTSEKSKTYLEKARSIALTLPTAGQRTATQSSEKGGFAHVVWGLIGSAALGLSGFLVSNVLSVMAQELTKNVAVPAVWRKPATNLDEHAEPASKKAA